MLLLSSTEKSVSSKAKILNQVAEEYLETNPEKMLNYAKQSLAYSLASKNPKYISLSYQNIGNANIMLGNYREALESFHTATNYLEKIVHQQRTMDAVNGLARAYGSIGVVFSEQSNYSKALTFYRKAIKLYEDVKNNENTGRLYNNIGIVYLSQAKEDKALVYFLKCLNIQEKLKDPTIGITITNIGNIYNHKKKYKTAFFYYQKALRLFKKFPNPRGLGELYNNLGLYYKYVGNPNKSYESFQLAAKNFTAIGDKFGISDTYFYQGDSYCDKKQYALAIKAMENSLRLSKELGVLDQIKNTEKKLYEIYEKLHQPEQALTHFKAYSDAKDSIRSEENIRNTIKAEMNFDFDKKELYYKKEREKSTLIYQEKIKRNQLIFILIGLFLLIFFAFVILLYNRQQRNKTLKMKLELIEYEQKALHLQMNPHFVFNCLGSISSFIIQNHTDDAIKYLSKFSKLMRLTLEFSKVPLIPIHKEIESLENYLELEQLRFNNCFSYTITRSEEIEDDVALPSLLLQPFIENSIIHGVVPKKENGKIDVVFEIDEENLVCTIQDNGIGIYHSQSNKEKLVHVHKSMALSITKNRLKMMETILQKETSLQISEISDETNEILGTKVILTIPIQYL
jgi:tetratricopeptide (TPR) repeat protein